MIDFDHKSKTRPKADFDQNGVSQSLQSKYIKNKKDVNKMSIDSVDNFGGIFSDFLFGLLWKKEEKRGRIKGCENTRPKNNKNISSYRC